MVFIRTKRPLIPIAVATEFNKAVSGNTNVFATDLAPTYEVGIFRIAVAVSPAAIIRVRITRNKVSKDLDLNAGAALTANALYAFDVPVRKGDKINIRFSTTTTIQYLTIDEIGTFGP